MNMLQEISRISLPISKNYEVSLSWHNSILAVRTEKLIFVYEFSRNLACTSKKLELTSSDMPIIKTSPLTGLIPYKFTSEKVCNADFTEMLVEPSLWPHSELLVEEMVTFADSQWSTDLLLNNQCVLAVLNNIGNVNFFAKCHRTWKSVLDLSELVKKIYMSLKNRTSIETLEELKDLADTLETSAIAWGPTVEHGCLFATAQKKGSILFWLLESKQGSIEPQFFGETSEPIVGEILSIAWLQKTEKAFLLICSNVFGQIYCYDCSLIKNEIKIGNVTCLWSHKDRMISRYIKHLQSDDKIVLFFNKHRHLLVQVMDKNCNVLMQRCDNINDYRITNMNVNRNGLFLTTANFKVYKINLNITETELQFHSELIPIENSESFSAYDLQDVASSRNNVIWAFGAKDRKILPRRTHKSVEIIFFTDIWQSDTALLLENPTRTFTDYWDCIERLRYQTMKLKALPMLDFNHFLQEADKDIYKMKLYLVFLHFHHNLENQLKNKSRKQMPENSIDKIKEHILALHACQLLNELYQNSERSDPMTNEFQLKSYIGAKRFLKYYCQKYDREETEFVNADVLSLTKLEEEIECQGCDEILEGFSCKNGHFSMFCSMTFTPIEGLAYLSCQICGCTFRIELYENNPKCIFCDLSVQ